MNDNPESLEGLHGDRVVFTRKNRPIGVFMSYEEFRRVEHLMELLEDFTLGHLALMRAQRKSKYLRTCEEAMRTCGLT